MATKMERVLRAVQDYDEIQDNALGTVLDNLHDTLNNEKGMNYEQVVNFYHGVVGAHILSITNLTEFFLEGFAEQEKFKDEFVKEAARILSLAITQLLPKSLPTEVMEKQCELMSEELIEEFVKGEVRH